MNNKNKGKIILIIIIVLIVIGLLGTGSFFIIKDIINNNNSNQNNVVEDKEIVTPLMYEITKEGSDNKIYLFGSIHMANIYKMEFPKYLLDAYNNSDYIACEFDINKFLESVDQTELAQSFLYMDGTTLKDHVNDDVLYNKIIDFVKDKFGYEELFTNQFKLVYIESMIEQYFLKESGIATTEGIDTHFLDKAKKDNKIILEVESYEFQANLENSFPDRYYILSISDALNNLENGSNEIKVLYESWKKGNEEEITNVVLTEIENGKYNDEDLEIIKESSYKMIDERNIGMKNKLEEYFNSDKKVFFMVGAAHLVGENGIANLLKNDGYNVRIIK